MEDVAEGQEVDEIVEHAYARPWKDFPRQLTREDMINMNLPERFQAVSYQDVHDTLVINGAKVENEAKAFLARYLERLRDMRRAGMGVLFNGPNGTGKTYAACVLLKAFRMHGQSCTYAHVETFRTSLFSDEVVDLAGRPLKYRCFDADVLLLDDLGKEVKSTKSAHELYALEHLVRERYSRNKVTLYTTNMNFKKLEEAYKTSTMSVIQGNTTTLTMKGENKRLGAHADLRSFLRGEE